MHVRTVFDKSIQQGVERLLAPDNAEIVTGHAFKTSGNPILSFGQLGPPVQFVMDCRPDERTRARIATHFDRFHDPIPIFSAQSDRDPGSACRACVLSHKVAPYPLRGL
jgi:hypothetical protein